MLIILIPKYLEKHEINNTQEKRKEKFTHQGKVSRDFMKKSIAPYFSTSKLKNRKIGQLLLFRQNRRIVHRFELVGR